MNRPRPHFNTELNGPQRMPDGKITDLNYLRYPGWQESNYAIREFYSPAVIRMISRKISELTAGVEPDGKLIVVPDERIIEVMDSIQSTYRRPVGDIYSRYIVPNEEQDNVIQSWIDQTVEVLTSAISNHYGIMENNRRLTKWVQVLGDFNQWGLMPHPKIKLQEKRPTPMQFHMNY